MPARAAAVAALGLLAGLGGCAPTVTGADFAGWQSAAVRQGKLRIDREAAEIPVTNAMLVENFRRIAFGLEPSANAGRTELDELARWEEPLRWKLYGPGPEAGAVEGEVGRAFDMLAGITGLDIAPAAGTAEVNVSVLFLRPDDYEAASTWARHIHHDLEDAIRRFRTAGANPCAGRLYARLKPDGGLPAGSLSHAFVLIRTGLGERLRSACVEEELAQSLGLLNDDFDVRPSIFNDDQEFQNLTRHDELLLRILYHPRLRPGMTSAEAMPVVAQVVEELRPGG